MQKFLESPQYQPLRVVILAMLAIVLGWGVIKPSHGQNARAKTFPYGKQFVAAVAVCSTEQYAKEVADDESASIFSFYRMMGACEAGQVEVKYLRQVYSSTHGYGVYEVEIAGHKVFAITDWKPDSI